MIATSCVLGAGARYARADCQVVSAGATKIKCASNTTTTRKTSIDNSAVPVSTSDQHLAFYDAIKVKIERGVTIDGAGLAIEAAGATYPASNPTGPWTGYAQVVGSTGNLTTYSDGVHSIAVAPGPHQIGIANRGLVATRHSPIAFNILGDGGLIAYGGNGNVVDLGSFKNCHGAVKFGGHCTLTAGLAISNIDSGGIKLGSASNPISATFQGGTGAIYLKSIDGSIGVHLEGGKLISSDINGYGSGISAIATGKGAVNLTLTGNTQIQTLPSGTGRTLVEGIVAQSNRRGVNINSDADIGSANLPVAGGIYGFGGPVNITQTGGTIWVTNQSDKIHDPVEPQQFSDWAADVDDNGIFAESTRWGNSTVTLQRGATINAYFPAENQKEENAAIRSVAFGTGSVTVAMDAGATINVFGNWGIFAEARGSAGSVNVMVNGTINGTASTAVGAEIKDPGNAVGSINIAVGGKITGGGTLDKPVVNAVTQGGPITIDNAGSIASADGEWRALAIATAGGAATINNSGMLTGAMSLAGAGSSLTNTGLWNTGGESTFGPNSIVTNFGILSVSGAATLRGQTSFSNIGVISMNNGAATDKLTIIGDYFGGPNSTLNVDVDSAARRTDQLVITGQASGTTTVNVTLVGRTRAFLATPVTIVQAPPSSLAAFVPGDPPPALINYSLSEVAPGSWGLTSTLNGAAASVPAANIPAAVNAINLSFLEPIDCMTLLCPLASQSGSSTATHFGGVWTRVTGGQVRETTNVAQTGLVEGASIQTRTDYAAIQSGLDSGPIALGTGWRARLGIMGGSTDAWASTADVGSISYRVPFVGTYARIDKGPLFADLFIREDFYNLQVNNSTIGVSGSSLVGNATTVGGNAGYRFDFGAYFFTADLAVSWTSMNVGWLDIGSAQHFAPDRYNSILGRASGRLGTTWKIRDLTLDPFISLGILHEFENASATTQFIDNNTGATVPIMTDRIGTILQLGTGLAAHWGASDQSTAMVRADLLSGDNFYGFSVTGSIRFAL